METEMIQLEVNGVAVSVPKGSNLLTAAKAANIKIPTPTFAVGVIYHLCSAMIYYHFFPSQLLRHSTIPSAIFSRLSL